MLDPMNVILVPTGVNAVVEEFGVGVALSQVGDPGALALPRPLKHRQTNNPSLDPGAKVALLRGERSFLLSNIQPRDDEECSMKLNHWRITSCSIRTVATRLF